VYKSKYKIRLDCIKNKLRKVSTSSSDKKSAPSIYADGLHVPFPKPFTRCLSQARAAAAQRQHLAAGAAAFDSAFATPFYAKNQIFARVNKLSTWSFLQAEIGDVASHLRKS
jgi:hypothetical protein